MQKQNNKEDCDIDQLIEVCQELNDLIEDNNQNIKDCYHILQKIQNVICPPKKSLISRALSKILNKNVRNKL